MPNRNSKSKTPAVKAKRAASSRAKTQVKRKPARKPARKATHKATHRRPSRFKRELIRIAEYMISGGVWFWSGYILIVTLDDPLRAGFGDQQGLFVANFVGNAVGLSLNFLLERYWVFKTTRRSKLFTATKRYAIYTILNAFILNYIILQVLSDRGIDPKIGQFVAAGFFTVWNYFWYKFYVFKGMDPKPRRTKHHA